MQSKLLRAIQERSVRPIGSTQEDAVDVRIVSATHKDLHAEVQASRFRQDLFYRLNVIEIAVPALRERRSDLPALCAALLERIARDAGMPVPTLSADVIQRLSEHPLRGNVRELENLLHRAVALSDGDMLHLDFVDNAVTPVEPALEEPVLLTEPVPAAAPSSPTRQASAMPSDLQGYLDEQERQILIRALQETGFNRTAAAARLGLSLRQIRYRIARLGIATPNGDDGNGLGADE
jgi:two-component system response regulator PilR (NtrC family)